MQDPLCSFLLLGLAVSLQVPRGAVKAHGHTNQHRHTIQRAWVLHKRNKTMVCVTQVVVAMVTTSWLTS